MRTITTNNATYKVEDKTFYDLMPLILDEPCQGCAAYETIGHCGAWGPGCWVLNAMDQVESFIEIGVTPDELADWILWKECVEPEILSKADMADFIDWLFNDDVEEYNPYEEDYYASLNYDPFEEVRYLTDKELYL